MGLSLEAKLIILALLLIGCLTGGAFAGWTYEHNQLQKIEADLNSKVAVQTALVSKLNQENIQNADTAQTTLISSLDSVHSYYKSHPVIRVHYVNGSCTVSSTSGDTSSPDAASSSGDVTAFISPYSPEACEQVATRLDGLQKLLTKDGVTVK